VTITQNDEVVVFGYCYEMNVVLLVLGWVSQGSEKNMATEEPSATMVRSNQLLVKWEGLFSRLLLP
jgi:hypothetical protein